MLGGVLLARQIVTGRVLETPQDLKDITLAVLSGDFAALSSTLAQRGNNLPPDVSGTVAAGTSGGQALSGLLNNPTTSSDLLAKCVELGQAAKGYILGGVGPNYYDCSGLVWRAMKDLDIYTGPRFTTHTFVAAMGGRVKRVTTPAVGDVVLWPAHHMGVVSGPDKMYSAMSPSSGIGYGTISASAPSLGGNPSYYRLVPFDLNKTDIVKKIGGVPIMKGN